MTGPAIAIHAGAGALGGELRRRESEVRGALLETLQEAARSLSDGAPAVDAAQAAVQAMEAFPLFNAGTGAALCSDGTAELSAALMRGSDLAAGAVAGVRTVTHPIAAARLVLESPEVLLIGGAADEQAQKEGLLTQANEGFVTDRQRARLDSGAREDHHGTVGAVCVDSRGVLAAATSTGGITGQPPGRVGDSPLIGAGTWADARVAISCTGDGEAFIRQGVARYLATLLELGTGFYRATRQTLHGVSELGASGGLIALTADAAIDMPFNTEAMPRGQWRQGEQPQVWLA